MANPYSSGGGGPHLEARIVASTFVAILCEAPVRGLFGHHATEVRTQRADFQEPLDDLIITGLGEFGVRTKLHLQVKNKLTFTENDEEWVDVLCRAWDTFSAQGFDPIVERYGVAIGTYHARVDYHYQAVLSWAAQSIDSDHFIERIEKKDFSHKDKRAFVETIKVLLGAHVGRALTNEEIWRFLKGFIIVYLTSNRERHRETRRM